MQRTEAGLYRNMVLNGLALTVLAVTLTGPVHEGVHMITQMLAGCTPHYLSFGVMEAVGTPTVDMGSTFWRLMFDGSAALFNVVVGIVLTVMLRMARLKPLSRHFVLLLAIFHLCMGFGYFLRDGIAYSPNNGMGDWSKVLDNFGGSPVLRVCMLVVGSAGYLFALYLAYYEAYHFIEHNEDKDERVRVTSALYLWPYLFNAVVFTLLTLFSPLGALDSLIISGTLNLFGYFPLMIGYLYAGRLLKPMKKSIYYFSPCSEEKPVLWVAALVVLALDAFVLCPGIYF